MNAPMPYSRLVCSWATMPLLAVFPIASARPPLPMSATVTSATPQASAGASGDCFSCHTCERPTSDRPCIRSCALSMPATIERELGGKLGPEVVILDELQNLYLPVPFDHRGHAEMARMTHGCATCHHYTAQGAEHPACKTCHEVALARENIRKPGLKGAYHRQCLSCHREWSHNTNCVVCHQPRTGASEFAAVATPVNGDIVGRMHPPIPEPDTEIYSVHSNGSESRVIFRHEAHIHRFGLRCVECHHEDSCARCHEVGRQHEQRIVTLAQHHHPCSHCHGDDMRESEGRCGRCHWKTGEATPAAFDHANTGWPLSEYHRNLSCRACHASVPFTPQNRTCNGCHTAWSPDTFNHAVTSQMLDATHIDFDCEDCHTDRRFEAAPTCDSCHDEEEGIIFPARRPSELAYEHPTITFTP